MPSRCCIQFVSKSGRPSCGHRTGKDQSSSQFPKRVVLKNVLTIRQLHSSPMLVKKERKKVKSLSRVWLFATPWTGAYQAPPSMGFSRQEYWSGFPFPSPRDLSDPGIKPRSPTLQADALTSEPSGKPPMLVRSCLKSFMLGFSIMWTKNFQMSKLGLEKED